VNVITVRPEQPPDEAFLFELYTSTRQEELDAWGWPPEMRRSFLAMQFRASLGRQQAYPDAEFQIVMLDGLNAGRLIIHRTREELRVVDMALLPQYRNHGFGAALLQRVFGEAAATRKPLRLKVLKGNRAIRLYHRLGFAPVGGTETHIEMEWRPAPVPVFEPVLPDAVKLPLPFNVPRLQADLAGLRAREFVPHFNQAGYEGDWSALPLRSVGGRTDHIYPNPTAKDAFADTPLLARCPAIQAALGSLPCPRQSVRLLRLKAGSIIKEHRDHELGFEDGEVRLHIPIITNPEVHFILDQVRIIMNEGECWYLNVNRPHSVANRGTGDRIHLVIDCVVNDWLRELLLAAAARTRQQL
jgi:GNAT superfamily N-acetyltransferase